MKCSPLGDVWGTGVRRNRRQGVGEASLFLRERTERHVGRITGVTFVGAAGERIE